MDSFGVRFGTPKREVVLQENSVTERKTQVSIVSSCTREVFHTAGFPGLCAARLLHTLEPLCPQVILSFCLGLFWFRFAAWFASLSSQPKVTCASSAHIAPQPVQTKLCPLPFSEAVLSAIFAARQKIVQVSIVSAGTRQSFACHWVSMALEHHEQLFATDFGVSNCPHLSKAFA